MALKFHLTPADTPKGDEPNSHVKATTAVEDTVEALRAAFGDAVREVTVYAGEHTVLVEADQIREICHHLKKEVGVDYLVDVGGVDRFTEEGRLEVF